jgi:integrase
VADQLLHEVSLLPGAAKTRQAAGPFRAEDKEGLRIVMAKKRGNNEGSISKRKDGLWQVSMTMGRHPITGKLKRVFLYATTRKEAAEKLANALHDYTKGSFVAPHKRTLGDWLDTWLWEYKRPRLRPITFDSYEMLIRRHLKPALGYLLLRDLRPEHLQQFYNDKMKAGHSPRTVRYCHTILHGALAQAERHQLVVRNVSKLTELPPDARKEMQTLSRDQIVATLLPAVAKDRLFSAILLVIGTGLRRGELLALRWQDIELTEGLLHVRQTLVRVRNHEAEAGSRKTTLVFQQPKTAQSRRTLPLPEGCLMALKHHKAQQAQERLTLGEAYQDQGLVFCQADGKPIDPRNFARSFAKMLRQAGLPRIRVHDTWHTFATLMLELGESPKTVQTMLGHSRVAITLDIYSHVSLDLEKRAAAKLNTVLMGVN